MSKKVSIKLLLVSSLIFTTSLTSKPAFSEGFEDVLNNLTNNNDSNNNENVDPNRNSSMPPMFPKYTPETSPRVMKTSIVLDAGKESVFWKNPKAKDPEYNTSSWYPRITFDIQGPITAGSQVYVEFLKPNGKKWLSANCDTPEIQPGYTKQFTIPRFDEKEAINEIGTFKFLIKIKNELEGGEKTLYTGTYKVTKFHVGNNLPQFKNQFEFVVDQDWTMPIGYLILKRDGDERGLFSFATWIKGDDADDSKYAGYLYYNGKLVANTKTGGGQFASYSGGSVNDIRGIMTSGMEKEPQWHLMRFWINYAILYGLGTINKYTDFHNISKNTGEYELKVLRNGKLARTAKFNVTKEGSIVHNYGEWNSKSEYWIPLPVKITSPQDQKYDANAWKTNMYFGNPIKGLLD